MDSIERILEAIAVLEKFIADCQGLVVESRRALEVSNGVAQREMLKLRSECIGKPVRHLLLPRGIIGTLQEMQIYTLDDLVRYCNTFGVPRLRRIKRAGRKGYLALLEELSAALEDKRDLVLEFSDRVE